MVTCKQFLKELNDFLDPALDSASKAHLDAHVAECPNCFVVVDTTKKTLAVYKGMEPVAVPDAVRSRLLSALERKQAARRQQI